MRNLVIPYPTPKIARIKDSKLGLLRYSLMFIIFLYVGIYLIMWKGAHLESKNLSAVYQLQLDHPTRNHCNSMNIECMQNFSSLATLPYCAQSPLQSDLKLPCQLWDAPQASQVTDEGLMIPTHVATYLQKPGCKPSAGNNWSCIGWLNDFIDKKGHAQVNQGQARPVSDIFIADVQRFTLLIDHSVRSRLGHRYYAAEMQGYWLDCKHEGEADSKCQPRPIHCGGTRHCSGRKLDKAGLRPVAAARGARRSLSLTSESAEPRRPQKARAFLAKLEPESVNAGPPEETLGLGELGVQVKPPNRTAINYDLDHYGVVGESAGDVFMVGKLLEIANVSLDRRRHHVPSWVGGSYRSSGFVLVIRIHYSNGEDWLGLKALPWHMMGPRIHYTYRVTKHASHDEYVLTKVRTDPVSKDRMLKEYHGIRILLEQSGAISVWDNVQLLLILTTTLALMAVSNFITDTVALQCMPRSDEYFAIKYERPMTRKKEAHYSMDSADTDGAMETEPDDNIQRFSSITM